MTKIYVRHYCRTCCVISDISCKSSMAMLRAIIQGTTDSKTLSEMAKGSLMNKIPELRRALKGSIRFHQMQMLKLQMEHIDFLTKSIEEMDEDIKKKTESMNEYIDLLDEIPGIGRRSAERIIAETGIEMKQSPFEIHAGGMCTLGYTP